MYQKGNFRYGEVSDLNSKVIFNLSTSTYAPLHQKPEHYNETYCCIMSVQRINIRRNTLNAELRYVNQLIKSFYP